MIDPAVLLSAALEKRTWIYVMRPQAYGIEPCSCGNLDPDWSEFKRHLWCAACEKDFLPAQNGIFEGPISVMTTQLLGISLDRLNLETQEIERFFLHQELPAKA